MIMIMTKKLLKHLKLISATKVIQFQNDKQSRPDKAVSSSLGLFSVLFDFSVFTY